MYQWVNLLDVLFLLETIHNFFEFKELLFKRVDFFLQCHFFCSLRYKSDGSIQVLLHLLDSLAFGNQLLIFYSKNEFGEDVIFRVTLGQSELTI